MQMCTTEGNIFKKVSTGRRFWQCDVDCASFTCHSVCVRDGRSECLSSGGNDESMHEICSNGMGYSILMIFDMPQRDVWSWRLLG